MVLKMVVKKLCPKCGKVNLSFVKGAKNRIINTLDGLQEWSFNSVYFCRKCDYRNELYDIIPKELTLAYIRK